MRPLSPLLCSPFPSLISFPLLPRTGPRPPTGRTPRTSSPSCWPVGPPRTRWLRAPRRPLWLSVSFFLSFSLFFSSSPRHLLFRRDWGLPAVGCTRLSSAAAFALLSSGRREHVEEASTTLGMGREFPRKGPREKAFDGGTNQGQKKKKKEDIFFRFLSKTARSLDVPSHLSHLFPPNSPHKPPTRQAT